MKLRFHDFYLQYFYVCLCYANNPELIQQERGCYTAAKTAKLKYLVYHKALLYCRGTDIVDITLY